MRHLSALLLALSSAMLGGCASGPPPAREVADGSDHSIARKNAYTLLVEVRADDDIDISGYLVEFEELPVGIVDRRPYPVGTILVQDIDLNTIGFLTPGGHAFRFDDEGRSHSLGYGHQNKLVARVLNTSADLRFRPVSGSR
ncbi:MAG: hypothetical protein P8N09_02560 [Planctomycetota bacterium]|jgi:hypothetical protein|nr:hypothetical protein [Planctomycetota bacterium]